MKVGILIIDSLLWENDKNDHKDFKLNWRDVNLSMQDKIQVFAPIRYGYHSVNTFSTVFSKEYEENNQMGTAFLVPVKNRINSFDDLLIQAQNLSEAKNRQDKKLVKTTYVEDFFPVKSCIIGILCNPFLNDKIKNEILEKYNIELRKDGFEECYEKFKLGNEKTMFKESGELDIKWLQPVNKNEKRILDSFDIIITACQRPNKRQYPDAIAILNSIRYDVENYFHNNVENGITTFQDNEILELMKIKRTVGVVSCLDKKFDKGYVQSSSEQDYNDNYSFRPSSVPFKIELGQLIYIEVVLCEDDVFSHNSKGIAVKFCEFDPQLHNRYLNISKIWNGGNGGLSLFGNKKIIEYLIENDIADHTNMGIINLKKIKRQYEFYKSKEISSDEKLNSIRTMASQYDVRYMSGGHNKPGDWSRGWIKITTSVPKNVIGEYNLDIYLSNLFPTFNVDLAKGEDDMECRYTKDIVRKLEDGIGEIEIKKIKKLCKEVTKNIQDMAVLVYSIDAHTNSLYEEYSELKNKIISHFKLLDN